MENKYNYKFDNWLVNKSLQIFDMKMSVKKLMLIPIANIFMLIDFVLYGWIPFTDNGKLIS